jgi:hypothetical protein
VIYNFNIFQWTKIYFTKSGSRKWIGFGEVGKVDLKKNGDKIILIDENQFREF